MEKVTGFLFQLIGAASRNPVCNLPFGINRYVHRDPVISPEFPLQTKHSDIKRTLPPLGERLQRPFGIRGRMICQTERLPMNWMLLACIFLFFKNAPAVHQV